jgi:ABC-type nitrate/sulfonate/bicarbonate transport system substrate-binding protein
MPDMKIKKCPQLWIAMVLIAATFVGAPVHAADKVVRIAHQKLSTLALLRSTGQLEDKLKTLGYKVTWTEFPAGPQLDAFFKLGLIPKEIRISDAVPQEVITSSK